MKELISFSLKRRFLNKTNKMLMILLLVLFLLGAFLDKVIDLFVESDQKVQIKIVNIDVEQFELNDYLTVNDDADIEIEYENNQFTVSSESVLSPTEMMLIESSIYPYYEQQLPIEIRDVLFEYRHPQISYVSSTQENHQQKHDNLFMVITALYFMMLGFAGMLASEVVAEKTSNILEMIGTSVSLKTHYYSKILIGWLSILIQFVMIGSIGLIGFIVRYFVDDGKGLLTFLKKNQLVQVESDSISQLVGQLFDNPQALIDLGLSLLFLFIGILVIQLILVVITTRVNTIEEASSLQNPFYMGLLFLYYAALLLNNPVSMSSGWGYFLSFVPIFSMIFMPMRLMLYPLNVLDIGLSLTINLVFLVFVIVWGSRIYVNNVLNFTSKIKLIKFVKK